MLSAEGEEKRLWLCYHVKLTRLGLIGFAQPEWWHTHVVFIYHAMITTEP
jgi:hypothetical protein